MYVFSPSSGTVKILNLIAERQSVPGEMQELRNEAMQVLERGSRLVWEFGGSKWVWVRGRLRGVEMAPMQETRRWNECEDPYGFR